MWFHALEFAVSCTTTVVVQPKYLVYFLLLTTVETRATELRFFSRCPRRHLVHACLAIAAATVLDRAAEEQSTFYTAVAAELHTSYQIITFSDKVRLEGGHVNRCRFATLTGVHRGAHICLAKLWFKGKVRS